MKVEILLIKFIHDSDSIRQINIYFTIKFAKYNIIIYSK